MPDDRAIGTAAISGPVSFRLLRLLAPDWPVAEQPCGSVVERRANYRDRSCCPRAAKPSSWPGHLPGTRTRLAPRNSCLTGSLEAPDTGRIHYAFEPWEIWVLPVTSGPVDPVATSRNRTSSRRRVVFRAILTSNLPQGLMLTDLLLDHRAGYRLLTGKGICFSVKRFGLTAFASVGCR